MTLIVARPLPAASPTPVAPAPSARSGTAPTPSARSGTPPSARAGTAPTPSARPTTADDLAALVALAERCSGDALYRRFHGATGTPLRRELVRAAAGGDDAHRSWLVEADGAVRGLATLAQSRDGESHVAFLVEDGWQRRGVGRALARELHRAARDAGVAEVVADVQADNTPALRFAKALFPAAIVAFVGGGESRLTVPVAPAGP